MSRTAVFSMNYWDLRATLGATDRVLEIILNLDHHDAHPSRIVVRFGKLDSPIFTAQSIIVDGSERKVAEFGQFERPDGLRVSQWLDLIGWGVCSHLRSAGHRYEHETELNGGIPEGCDLIFTSR
jgi:hypothetical protein